LNTSHFNVERRFEAEGGFNNIGEVKAHGNSFNRHEYRTSDYDISRVGAYYYRLKQTDLDGTSSYSEVRLVRVIGEGSEVMLYPNPTTDELNVQLFTSERSALTLEMFDELGQRIDEQYFKSEIEKGTTTIKLSTQSIPDGVFYLKVTIGGEVKLARFTKI